MKYLVDELSSYENDFSDALVPTSREADASFAGEAALAHPASTEELRMVHASLTADMASLRAEVASLHKSYSDHMDEMRRNLVDSMSNLMQETLAPFTALLRPQATGNMGPVGEYTVLTPVRLARPTDDFHFHPAHQPPSDTMTTSWPPVQAAPVAQLVLKTRSTSMDCTAGPFDHISVD